MPKNTGIKNREAYINKVLKEDKKYVGKDTPYGKYLTSLKELVRQTNEILDNGGNLNKESHEKLVAQYMDVAKCSIECRDLEESQTRRNVVEHIFKLISKDLKALNSLDKNNPGKIQAAFESSRSLVVKVPDDLAHRVGGQVSDRFPMKDADNRRGFFTARTDTAHDKEWDALVESIRSSGVEEDFMGPFERLKTDHEARYKLMDSIVFPVNKYNDKENWANIARDLGFFGTGYQAEQGLRMDEFKNVLKGIKILQNKGHKLLVGYHMKDRLGYDVYTRNDSKNAAMYDVAKLLGCEKLVAKAVPMLVVNGDNIMKGTFMEHAEGSDLDNLKGDDPLFQYSVNDSPFNKDLYRDLADLQMLDYICGNIDRHKGNMTYKTKKDEHGNVKLTGVVAIDNDSSFPEMDILEREFQNDEYNEAHIFKPENFRYVNEKTADIILHMDRAQLETVLRGNNLSRTAIDKAWERTLKVKDALEKMKENHISYVEELNDKTYTDPFDMENPFCKTQEMMNHPSIFTGFNEQLGSEVKFERDRVIAEQKQRFKTKHKQWRGIDKEELIKFKESKERQNEARVAKGAAMDKATLLRANFRLIEQMESTMKRINRLKSPTREFSNMKNAIYELSKCSKEFTAKMKSAEGLKDKDYERFDQLLNDMNKATQTYIEKKGASPKTVAGRERHDAALSFLNKSEKLLENFDAVKKMDQPEVEIQENELGMEV